MRNFSCTAGGLVWSRGARSQHSGETGLRCNLVEIRETLRAREELHRRHGAPHCSSPGAPELVPCSSEPLRLPRPSSRVGRRESLQLSWHVSLIPLGPFVLLCLHSGAREIISSVLKIQSQQYFGCVPTTLTCSNSPVLGVPLPNRMRPPIVNLPFGDIAVDVACRCGHTEIVQMLEAAAGQASGPQPIGSPGELSSTQGPQPTLGRSAGRAGLGSMPHPN